MKTLFLVYSSTESLQKQDFRFKFWTENRVKHCFKLNSRPFLPSRVASPRVAQAGTVAEKSMLAEVASPTLVVSNGQQEAQSNPCAEASNHVETQCCEQRSNAVHINSPVKIILVLLFSASLNIILVLFFSASL